MSWIFNGIIVYFFAFFFLFASGLLIQLNLIYFSPNKFYKNNFADIIVKSFVISLIINGVLSGVLSFAEFGLDKTKYILLFIDLILVLLLALCWRKNMSSKIIQISNLTDIVTVLIIMAMFIIMAYYGGLLDIMADGWWHMSIANRMVQENTILIRFHPFAGIESASFEVFYPPLWHLQLALIEEASQLSLPIIWHFMAAINVSLLLLSVYLFVNFMTQDKKIALLAVILHIFLVGGLNSYDRTGTWPGYASYVLLYYAFYLIFKLLAQLNAHSKSTSYWDIINALDKRTISLILLTCIGLLGLHGTELALFSVAICTYLLAIIFLELKNRNKVFYLEIKLLILAVPAYLVFGVLATIVLLPNRISQIFSTPQASAPYLNFIVPFLTVCIIMMGALIFRLKIKRTTLLILLSVYLFFFSFFLYQIIDFEHIRDLFFPEIKGRHVPRAFSDQFNNRVYLPFWDHQLRGALLFSGLLSLVLGLWLLFFGKERMYIFIGANAILAFLVLTSPYLFTFMSFIFPMSTVYRIHILLLSPVIIACFIRWLINGNSVNVASVSEN